MPDQTNQPFAPDPDPTTIAFVSTMGLLFNPFFWWDMLKVVVFSCTGMWLAVFLVSLWIDPTDPVALPLVVLPMAAAGLTALLVVASLIMGNRWSFDVRIGPDGVFWSAGRRERAVNRTVLVLSLLSGRPGPIGSSLLSTSQQSGGMDWEEIRRAKVHHSRRVISLRDSWHVVQRLYVSEDVWPRVVTVLETGLREGARVRSSAAPPRVRRRNWAGVALWCAVTLAATLATQAWDLIPDEGRGPALFGGVFLLGAVIARGPLRRILAALSGAAMTYFLVLVAAEAVEPFESLFTSRSTPTWTLDTPLLAVSIGAAVLLLGIAAWRLLGRGRPPGQASPGRPGGEGDGDGMAEVVRMTVCGSSVSGVEVGDVAEGRHWPFGADGETDRQRESERERMREDHATDARRKVRFDRLIVGGRAHSRKRGLS